MVRVARGICADIVGSLKEGVGVVYPTRQEWKPEAAMELRRLCKAIQRIAVGIPPEENLAALSPLLENLSQALPNYSFEARSTEYRKRGETSGILTSTAGGVSRRVISVSIEHGASEIRAFKYPCVSTTASDCFVPAAST